MIGAIVGLGLPIAAALLVAFRLDPRLSRMPLTLPIALGLAFGLSSAVFFTLMLLPMRSRLALLGADTAVWIAIVAVLTAWSIRHPARVVSTNDAAPARSPRWFAAIAWSVFVVAAAFAVTRVVAISAVSPHGAWDAWAFWNAHARVLSLGYPGEWRSGMTAILHRDYPLLTPAGLARIWQYAGRDTIAAPIGLAAGAAAGIVVLLAASIAEARGAARGAIAAAALLGAPAFAAAAASQFADVPIAFYFLATFVMFERALATRRLAWWLAAGASAGFAAWTKNEGQAFLLFVAISMTIAIWRDRARYGRRPLAAVVIGALPAIAALTLFRWALPSPHEVLAGLSADRVRARLHNIARWRAIATALGTQIWFGGAAIAGVVPIMTTIALVSGVARPAPFVVRASAAVLGVMLLTYALVYLFSPYDLAWHLGTSAERVIVQLVPSTLWALSMWSRIAASHRTA